MDDKKPLPDVDKIPKEYQFVDRTPCLKPAGIKTNWGGSVNEALRNTSIDEMAEDFYQGRCKKQQQAGKLNCVRRSPVIPDDSMQELLGVELKKSRFVSFREKFSEDMYFKKAELGRAMTLNSKPKEIDNVNTTFGRPGSYSESLYEVVMPKKTFPQVNREYAVAHENYIISHKHYFPSEQVNRHYDSKNFSTNNIFGSRNNVDFTGKMVKKCMTECDRLVVVTKAQKQFLERTLGRLGKKVLKYNYVVPNTTAFGKPTCLDECDVQNLLENSDPCVRKARLVNAIGHLNKVRRSLHDRSDVHIFDIRHKFEKLDVDRTGYLQLQQIFDALRDLLIRLDEEKVLIAMKHFKILNDDKDKNQLVNYETFIGLIHIQVPVPETGSISAMPKTNYDKSTTYRDFCKDLAKREPGETLIEKPKVDIDDVRAKDCIEPDILTHYGLCPSDFVAIRPKAVIQRIFSRVIKEPEDFEEVWERAEKILKTETDEMSVNQLRTALEELREEKDPFKSRLFTSRR